MSLLSEASLRRFIVILDQPREVTHDLLDDTLRIVSVLYAKGHVQATDMVKDAWLNDDVTWNSCSTHTYTGEIAEAYGLEFSGAGTFTKMSTYMYAVEHARDEV